MARPLRIEFENAVYHLTSRGDRRETIFRDDTDHMMLLNLLEQACDRFDASVLAYCLMGNHYHLVLTTRRANLSALMRHVNGVYTQRFNRRHGQVGHVFQGRFKAILVDRDAYLLAVCRYVEFNPVACNLVRRPGDWPWSSWRAHTAAAESPAWLDTRSLHGLLTGRTPTTARATAEAAARWSAYTAAAAEAPLWQSSLRQQIFLGDEAFVQRTQAQLQSKRSDDVPQNLSDWLVNAPSREVALLRAHREGGMTLTAMARELELSVARVSQLVSKAERQAPQDGART